MQRTCLAAEKALEQVHESNSGACRNIAQRLFVCRERFWPAISHCQFPVYLTDQEHGDLRFLSAEQMEAVIPSERTSVILCFSDTQDYIRFVLAYLLVETA